MKCAKCGTEMTALDSFRCASCGRMVCLQHRMPERHDCGTSDLGPGMQIRSIMNEKPAPEPAREPRPNPLAGQQVERLDGSQPQQKKKRFGLF